MEVKMKSEGKCLFCGKTFAKAGINRHLAAHLKEIAKTGNPGNSYFVKVEPHKKMDDFPYFLSLWIDGKTEMERFDHFLRDIWLECCRHKSEFKIRETPQDKRERKETLIQIQHKGDFEEYMQAVFEYDDYFEIGMEEIADDFFEKGLVMDYNFDFGSNTSLTITVIEEYPFKADSEIVLLSRNEQFEIVCRNCGKIHATKLCRNRWNFNFLCDGCFKKHAKKCDYCYEHDALPVVNSPRVGICGYTGGSIDKGRDGVYQLK
jgi:hypothetical protein